jgi:hypothetical protein
MRRRASPFCTTDNPSVGPALQTSRRLKDKGKPEKGSQIAAARKFLLSRTEEELRSNSQAARARAAIYRKL